MRSNMCSWLTTVKLLALFTLFHSGDAGVKCYLCSTKGNETGCRYPEYHQMPLVPCDQTALDKTREMARSIDPVYDKAFEVDTQAMARHIDLDCLKVVTKLGNTEHIIRGCQLAEQSSLDICHKIEKVDHDYLKKLHCSRCSSDRCNLAPTKLQLNSLLLALVLLLFVKC